MFLTDSQFDALFDLITAMSLHAAVNNPIQPVPQLLGASTNNVIRAEQRARIELVGFYSSNSGDPRIYNPWSGLHG